MIEYLVTAVVAVLAPSVGWVVSKTIDTSAKLDAHAASDAATFKAISEHLEDLKNGQQNQTDKLDQLVMGMLNDARKGRRERKS